MKKIKLKLNKKTITSLSKEELLQAKGGSSYCPASSGCGGGGTGGGGGGGGTGGASAYSCGGGGLRSLCGPLSFYIPQAC